MTEYDSPQPPAHQTEASHPDAVGIDTLDNVALLTILHRAQVEAAQSVSEALPALALGGNAMAECIRRGGRLVYAAAGSSGLMGLADGIEIHPTFGIPIPQILILRAGGLDDIQVPKGHVEDDLEAAARDAAPITGDDCVICLAASGNTPYPVEIMRIANERGATTIGIANNPDTLLLKGADIPVLLATPPEVIAGSTRMGAGTAQKMALNMMSTVMGVRLGHVMDGLMVNVVANNKKLFDRAERIVMACSQCDQDAARKALEASQGRVKEAVLLVRGATDFTTAQEMLAASEGNLRKALSQM